MKKIAGFKLHPAAGFFPLLEGDEFKALCADMKQYGQREPIVLFDGMILDGRNRGRACVKLKIKPKTKTYKGKDPIALVVSLNMARRHLTESQRAMAATKIAAAGHGGDRKSSGRSAGVTQKTAAAALGTSERSVRQAKRVSMIGTKELIAAVEGGHIPVSLADKLCTLPVFEQRKVVEETLAGAAPSKVVRSLNREKREAKMAQISKGNKALETSKQYGVILADPPWMYDEGTATPNRRIDNHYPPMALDEICALAVGDLAMKNAVLFLWVPSPLILEYAPQVLGAWGFKYKAQFIWHKIGGRRGTGHWNEGRHEHLLIAKRGDAPPPKVKARFPSVQSERVGGHSAKPETFRGMIEEMYPEAARIELFAREAPEGWDVWGNQS